MANESIGKTILVAALLCIVCSILVSTAAVKLKPLQEINKALFKKNNILKAAGLLEEGKDVEELFKNIEVKYVDIDTGDFNETINSKAYNVKAALARPGLSVAISPEADIANIKRRVKTAEVYLVKVDGKLKTIILPVYGKGLWSTMYAFLALESDGNTIKGFSFYDHGETPGLGGEIDNPSWQKQFQDKLVYDEDWNVMINVLKGKVNRDKPEAIHQADGLSGATLTTTGVKNMMRYWLGKDGFKKFLQNVRKQDQGA
ncbi:Na(+)-translocating NADH-quinone reductase subunit C [bacterium]|nr:Na(+)-translocating NADH-quinone reductase subunit C [bacterium]